MSKSKPKEKGKYAYPVEKDVPLPSKFTRDPYPFDVMEVGDCFTFPVESHSAVKSALQTFYKENGKEKLFTTRLGISGIVQGKKVGRTWRIE